MKTSRLLREELWAVPLLFLCLVGYRAFTHWLFPESAQFDLASEWETMLWSVVKLVFIITVAWLGLRIVLPPAYRYLKDKFYERFDEYHPDTKLFSSLLFYLSLFFAMVFLSSCAQAASSEKHLRANLIQYALAQQGIEEATGNNDGEDIDRYAAPFDAAGKGYSWCAMFTAWQFNCFNVDNPNNMWAPAWARSKDVVWSPALEKQRKAQEPQPGDAFTLFYNRLNRVGHVGIITKVTDKYFYTIEGNTNNAMSREGQGVWAHKRPRAKVYRVTDYITPHIKKHEKVPIRPNADCIGLFGMLPQGEQPFAGDPRTRSDLGEKRHPNPDTRKPGNCVHPNSGFGGLPSGNYGYGSELLAFLPVFALGLVGALG